MKKIYCIKCNKYSKFKNPKISYIKTLVCPFICDKCGIIDETIFTKLEIISKIKNLKTSTVHQKLFEL